MMYRSTIRSTVSITHLIGLFCCLLLSTVAVHAQKASPAEKKLQGAAVLHGGDGDINLVYFRSKQTLKQTVNSFTYSKELNIVSDCKAKLVPASLFWDRDSLVHFEFKESDLYCTKFSPKNPAEKRQEKLRLGPLNEQPTGDVVWTYSKGTGTLVWYRHGEAPRLKDRNIYFTMTDRSLRMMHNNLRLEKPFLQLQTVVGNPKISVLQRTDLLMFYPWRGMLMHFRYGPGKLFHLLQQDFKPSGRKITATKSEASLSQRWLGMVGFVPGNEAYGENDSLVIAQYEVKPRKHKSRLLSLKEIYQQVDSVDTTNFQRHQLEQLITFNDGAMLLLISRLSRVGQGVKELVAISINKQLEVQQVALIEAADMRSEQLTVANYRGKEREGFVLGYRPTKSAAQVLMIAGNSVGLSHAWLDLAPISGRKSGVEEATAWFQDSKQGKIWYSLPLDRGRSGLIEVDLNK